MLCWISKKNGNAITLWKNGVGVTETVDLTVDYIRTDVPNISKLRGELES